MTSIASPAPVVFKPIPQIHFNLFGGTMVGGDHNDIFLGFGSNYIKGHGGDDVFILAGSALDTNTIYGGDGNNRVIDFGNSFNSITLGTGKNTVDILGHGGGTIEVGYSAIDDFYYTQLQDGSLVQQWYTRADDYAGGDNVVNAGRGNTTIIDHAGNSILNGNVGDDNIYAGRGDDNLDGRAGKDFLYGDAGNDRLSGGDGDDILVGGQGFDIQQGGAGNDRYFFTVGDLIDLGGVMGGADELNFDGSDGRAGVTAVTGAGSDDILKIYSWQQVQVYEGAIHIYDQYGTDEWLVGAGVDLIGISVYEDYYGKG